jgi:hypothetical protein
MDGRKQKTLICLLAISKRFNKICLPEAHSQSRERGSTYKLLASRMVLWFLLLTNCFRTHTDAYALSSRRVLVCLSQYDHSNYHTKWSILSPHRSSRIARAEHAGANRFMLRESAIWFFICSQGRIQRERPDSYLTIFPAETPSAVCCMVTMEPRTLIGSRPGPVLSF